MQPSDEHAEIRRTVQSYIDALAGSDTELMAKIFHPDATLSGDFGQGVAVHRVHDMMIPFMKSLPPTSEHSPNFRGRVLSITQKGPMASAVIEEDALQGMNFTTYFQLHKLPDGWRITAKSTSAAGHG